MEFRFPRLRIQMLRSSESVCANLTEGFYSQYSTEYLQSLYRCRREARETVTHLRYAGQVEVLSNKIEFELLDRYAEALQRLGKLISSIERKIAVRGKGRPPFLASPSTDH
ncbi:MAG: four helix bundle protein [Nitrospirota bacterium]